MKQIYTKSYDSACISEQLPCLPNNPYFLKKKTDFVYSQILTEQLVFSKVVEDMYFLKLLLKISIEFANAMISAQTKVSEKA